MELENFNAKQYLANYADLRKAFGTDKAKQRRADFVAGKEGATFDAKQYLANYADLREAFGTDEDAARKHFKEYGSYEGRIDTDAYDKAKQHFRDYGKKEGRQDTITDELKQTIDTQRSTRRGLEDQLRNLGSDATEEQRQSLIQQITQATPGDRAAKAKRMAEAAQRRSDFVSGKEGATFDAKQYLANYKDLQDAFGDDVEKAKQHYKEYGAKEGRTDTKDKINVEEYLSQYKDLQDAFGDDRQKGLQHYIQHGIKEGRSQKGGTAAPDEKKQSFDAKTYLANYADLRKAFGKNTDAAQQHYLQYGIKEGRTDRAIESKATPTPTPTPDPSPKPDPSPTPTPDPSPTPTPTPTPSPDPSPTPTPTPTPTPNPDPRPTPPPEDDKPLPIRRPPGNQPITEVPIREETRPVIERDFGHYIEHGDAPFAPDEAKMAKDKFYSTMFAKAARRREQGSMRREERAGRGRAMANERKMRDNERGEVNVGGEINVGR